MFPLRWNFPFRKKDGSLSTIQDEIDSGGGGGYTLPTASASTKGGVKVGAGLAMDGEVLKNTNPTPYSLPTASDEILGGIKVGSGLSITDGVLSAAGGSGGGCHLYKCTSSNGNLISFYILSSVDAASVSKTNVRELLYNGIGFYDPTDYELDHYNNSNEFPLYVTAESATSGNITIIKQVLTISDGAIKINKGTQIAQMSYISSLSGNKIF